MTVFSTKGHCHSEVWNTEESLNRWVDCMRSLFRSRWHRSLAEWLCLEESLAIMVGDSSHAFGMARGCCPQNAVMPTTVGRKDISQNACHSERSVNEVKNLKGETNLLQEIPHIHSEWHSRKNKRFLAYVRNDIIVITVFSQKGIVILRCETSKNLSVNEYLVWDLSLSFEMTSQSYWKALPWRIFLLS